MTLDTLRAARGLEAASFTPEQAEALTKILREREEATLDELVTKEHLDHRLLALEQRLTIRLGVMIGLSIGFVAALVKLV